MRARMFAGLCWAVAAWAVAAQSDEGLEVKYKPLKFGGVQEFGSATNALSAGDLGVNVYQSEWIDHFGTYFVQEAWVNEVLQLQIGLGGVFQFGKPEKVQEAFGGNQYKMFFIGPATAKAMYHFGDVEKPVFSLGGGMFPYKYNPDAVNLGEYLFRSGPYPTFLQTGGLTVIGDNSAYFQGFQASSRLGNLSLDLMLYTETNLPPLYDWSLGLVANYKIADGLLELGAGVAMKRLISVDKQKTTREEIANSYFQRGSTWYVGDVRYYEEPKNLAEARIAAIMNDTTILDKKDTLAYALERARLQPIIDSLRMKNSTPGGWLDSTTGLPIGAKFYTPKGTIVMARMSLDLKKLFTSDLFSPEDLRIYAEAALLGVENYPVYYEKKADRIPMMAGVNIPTFGLLDLLAVQVEYFNSPHLNNHRSLGGENHAIPYHPSGTEKIYSKDSYLDLTKEDNYAWSVLLRRQLMPGLTLSGQLARDHLRSIGTDWFYGSRFEPGEILYKNSSWYWMLQIGWNI